MLPWTRSYNDDAHERFLNAEPASPVVSQPLSTRRRPRVRIQPAWWWDIFFAAIEARGNVAAAARAAGQRRVAVYEIASLNPEFKARWAAAKLAFGLAQLDRLTAEKRRRMERARFNLNF